MEAVELIDDSNGKCKVLRENACGLQPPSGGESDNAIIMAIGIPPKLVGLEELKTEDKARICKAVSADRYTGCVASLPVTKMVSAYIAGKYVDEQNKDKCGDLRTLIDEQFEQTLKT